MRTSICLAVVFVISSAAMPHAQMAHRLKGWIRTTGGTPIANAKVRADNLSGFRGEQFAGQKEHEVTSSDKGEWNITGIEAGLWLFSTSAPDTVPAVLVLPVKFSQRQQVSAVGNSLTWQAPLYAYPAAEHPILKTALDLLKEGKRDDATQALSIALGPGVPIETRVAAGELSLLVQHASMARTIFHLALQEQPKHPRAMLGAAMASLLARDWETAGKQIWDARDLAPRDQRQALAAAIDDLRGIARIQ
ncbi:MAG TPA: carboxypeptidase-like regulatory domain-containing protein [Vicinamibacterales bacterium]